MRSIIPSKKMQFNFERLVAIHYKDTHLIKEPRHRDTIFI